MKKITAILQNILEYEFLKVGEYSLQVYHVFAIISIFSIVLILHWSLKRYLLKTITDKVKKSRTSALLQLSKYFLVIMASAASFEIIGIDVTFLIAGSAALLVGLGFGIQSIFNDVVSGIILLFEGTVSINDIVEIEHLKGKVTHIDLRTSKILTIDNLTIVVPNSKLTSENVINWSHNRESTRFSINIGVAYGSDLAKVKRILESVAAQHEEVQTMKMPEARFTDFGSSSLDFKLLFYSFEMFRIEKIKSDLRFEIDRRFRNEGVTIPFPQQDLHIIK